MSAAPVTPERLRYPLTEARDAERAAMLAKRTLTNLYKQRPAWLANAHAKLDAAVAAAYGCPPIRATMKFSPAASLSTARALPPSKRPQNKRKQSRERRA